MPSLRPVLGGLLSENRHAAHLDASRIQHRMVDERRALTAKAVRHNDDRSKMLFSQKITDLIGSIETDGFEYPYGKNLWILQPRHPGHQLRNALRHKIGSLRITGGIRGDNDS